MKNLKELAKVVKANRISKTVSIKELEAIASEILPTGKAIQIETETLPTDILKVSKIDGSINPYYKKIRKVSNYTTQIISNYKKWIDDRSKAEGLKVDFQPSDFYAHRVNGEALHTHKENGQQYLMLCPNFALKNAKIKYFSPNGEELSNDFIDKFISKKERTADNQPQAKKVIPLMPKIENIKKLVCDNVEWVFE